MKKRVALSAFISLILLTGSVFTPALSQAPTPSDTPTFYRLVPGTYVNPWPRFTISYPKDWVERRADPQETFRASAPGPSPYPVFVVAFGPNPRPLDKLAQHIASVNRTRATDVSIIGDKASQLRDGSPAREIEIQMVVNGAPLHTMSLATRRGDLMVTTTVMSRNGRVGEDLKAIPYTMEFQPDRDRPVQVPPDVREFSDRMDNDIVSHDLAKVMAHYSDRYLHSGARKGQREQSWKQLIGSITSARAIITDFVPEGDRVYFTGLMTTNIGTFPITETSIIKENDQWKWYGNQREVVP
jgi:hypothetical protein